METTARQLPSALYPKNTTRKRIVTANPLSGSKRCLNLTTNKHMDKTQFCWHLEADQEVDQARRVLEVFLGLGRILGQRTRLVVEHIADRPTIVCSR